MRRILARLLPLCCWGGHFDASTALAGVRAEPASELDWDRAFERELMRR